MTDILPREWSLVGYWMLHPDALLDGPLASIQLIDRVAARDLRALELEVAS
jgi:hypothetical protein